MIKLAMFLSLFTFLVTPAKAAELTQAEAAAALSQVGVRAGATARVGSGNYQITGVRVRKRGPGKFSVDIDTREVR